MVLLDRKIQKKILDHIRDHGEIRKFDALRMCDNTAQLLRIIKECRDVVERDGFLTTNEEISDTFRCSVPGPLLRGHCVNGIGGSWMVKT